jgi:hypothetical protein
VFSSALFDTPDDVAFLYLDEIGRWHAPWADKTWVKRLPASTITKLIKARNRVDGFLDACLAEIERQSPRIVGFTSMFSSTSPALPWRDSSRDIGNRCSSLWEARTAKASQGLRRSGSFRS